MIVTQLLTELQTQIFSFLKLPDLNRVALVCKKWQQIADFESLWKILTLRDWPAMIQNCNLIEISWKGLYQNFFRLNQLDLFEDPSITTLSFTEKTIRPFIQYKNGLLIFNKTKLNFYDFGSSKYEKLMEFGQSFDWKTNTIPKIVSGFLLMQSANKALVITLNIFKICFCVESDAASINCRRLAVLSCLSKSITIFDLHTKENVHTFQLLPGIPQAGSVCFIDADKLLVYTKLLSSQHIYVFDLRNKTQIIQYAGKIELLTVQSYRCFFIAYNILKEINLNTGICLQRLDAVLDPFGLHISTTDRELVSSSNYLVYRCNSLLTIINTYTWVSNTLFLEKTPIKYMKIYAHILLVGTRFIENGDGAITLIDLTGPKIINRFFTETAAAIFPTWCGNNIIASAPRHLSIFSMPKKQISAL